MSTARLQDYLPKALFAVYLTAFFIYLFAPLVVMGAASFNASRFPTVLPWAGTTGQWFVALANDRAMWAALGTSIVVGIGVVVLSLPLGVAASLLLSSIRGKARGLVYAVMVSPMLTPGVVIGISTLIFWRKLGISGGIFLTILAQSSFITAFVMRMVSARLSRFDRTQEEAALDLGADRFQVFHRVLLPFLKPALVSAAFLAFLQSFENYNTTLFVRGVDTTLTVHIASQVRTGLTPAVNALGLILILLTIFAAIGVELARRRQETRAG